MTVVIDRLPPAQRSVLVLREMEQLEAADVSALLGLSDANQRVLLHRARARVRDHLETLLGNRLSEPGTAHPRGRPQIHITSP